MSLDEDNIDEFAAEGKPEHTPFMQVYTSDWTAGTIGFTLEQRGFYFEALKTMWEMKGGLPDDIKWLSCALRCDPRTARRLRSFLINKRKLKHRNNLLINERMEKEIARWKRKVRPNFGRSSAEVQPKLGQIFSEMPMKSTVVPFPPPDIRIQNPESREEDRSFRSGDEIERRPARAPKFVSEQALDAVRKIAPGWDRQVLLRKFLDWPKAQEPNDYDKAFLAWVRKFTKGQRAS